MKKNEKIKRQRKKEIKRKIKHNKKVSRKKKKINGSMDMSIVLTVLILCGIGFVMIFSASQYQALYKHGDAAFFLKKQLVFIVPGLLVMWGMSWIKYTTLKVVTPYIYVAVFAPLLYVLTTEPIMGAQRWIDIGGVSFQPSEVAKYMMVFFLAFMIEKYSRVIHKASTQWKLILIPGAYAGLILLQNNLSITAVVMFVGFTMLFVAGAKIKHLVPIGLSGLGAGVAFALLEPYRLKRVLTFMDPWADVTGDGYQIIHSFYALGTGGVFGEGLGGSKQKLSYIPEPQNDFIFSILGEEFGLIGCLIVIALFMFLIFKGIKLAMEVRDTFGKLIATGITGVIGIQCLVNVAVVTGSMPVTGVPLPFISYGGTSLIVNLIAIGVLLNISRRVSADKIRAERIEREKREEQKLESNRSFENSRY